MKPVVGPAGGNALTNSSHPQPPATSWTPVTPDSHTERPHRTSYLCFGRISYVGWGLPPQSGPLCQTWGRGPPLAGSRCPLPSDHQLMKARFHAKDSSHSTQHAVWQSGGAGRTFANPIRRAGFVNENQILYCSWASFPSPTRFPSGIPCTFAWNCTRSA